MKLITLNTWGGRPNNKATQDFFGRYSNVDIICLQEVREGGDDWIHDGKFEGIEKNLLSKTANTLDSHSHFFHPHYEDWFGLATFVRSDIGVSDTGEVFVYKEKGYANPDVLGDHARNIQYVRVNIGPTVLTVINFHGLWNGDGKEDSEDRLLQSDNIITFIKTLKTRVVLCGDFNLSGDTESLNKFKMAGLRNLISEHGVTSTRTSHYLKPERLADYIFVSEGVKVNDFKVLPDEVSDHSPLYLDFDLK